MRRVDLGKGTASQLLSEVVALREEVVRNATTDHHWRALGVLLDPFKGLGLLVLGTGVTMIATGASMRDALHQLSNVLPGLVLVLIYVLMQRASVSLEDYFLDHPDRMESFFAIVGEKTAWFRNLAAWAKEQGDAGADLRRAFGQIAVFARFGAVALALFLGGLLILYFALVAFLVWRLGSQLAVLWALAGLGTLCVGWAFQRRRQRRTRRRGLHGTPQTA